MSGEDGLTLHTLDHQDSVDYEEEWFPSMFCEPTRPEQIASQERLRSLACCLEHEDACVLRINSPQNRLATLGGELGQAHECREGMERQLVAPQQRLAAATAATRSALAEVHLNSERAMRIELEEMLGQLQVRSTECSWTGYHSSLDTLDRGNDLLGKIEQVDCDLQEARRGNAKLEAQNLALANEVQDLQRELASAKKQVAAAQAATTSSGTRRSRHCSGDKRRSSGSLSSLFGRWSRPRR